MSGCNSLLGLFVKKICISQLSFSSIFCLDGLTITVVLANEFWIIYPACHAFLWKNLHFAVVFFKHLLFRRITVTIVQANRYWIIYPACHASVMFLTATAYCILISTCRFFAAFFSDSWLTLSTKISMTCFFTKISPVLINPDKNWKLILRMSRNLFL